MIVAAARFFHWTMAQWCLCQARRIATDEIIANFNLARGIRVFRTPAYIVGTHLVTGDSADINFAREVARAKAK
jgi:hypothetical protein